MQELIWKVKPDLIIETGIAHGGSLILSASILAMLDISEAIENGAPFDPKISSRKVVGIDIDVRSHNREAIEAHPLASRIQIIEGSSISYSVIEEVKKIADKFNRILVCLDSNHTHEHVLAELEAYATLVTKDSYCIVFDTIVDDLPQSIFPDRPWGPGNNPKTAVHEFLKIHDEFLVDEFFEDKLQISVAPDGYLKRIKN
jgi:cephalosporin hydroxylase